MFSFLPKNNAEDGITSSENKTSCGFPFTISHSSDNSLVLTPSILERSPVSSGTTHSRDSDCDEPCSHPISRIHLCPPSRCDSSLVNSVISKNTASVSCINCPISVSSGSLFHNHGSPSQNRSAFQDLDLPEVRSVNSKSGRIVLFKTDADDNGIDASSSVAISINTPQSPPEIQSTRPGSRFSSVGSRSSRVENDLAFGYSSDSDTDDFNIKSPSRKIKFADENGKDLCSYYFYEAEGDRLEYVPCWFLCAMVCPSLFRPCGSTEIKTATALSISSSSTPSEGSSAVPPAISQSAPPGR